MRLVTLTLPRSRIGIRDTKRPLFASGDLLLGLELGSGALFGIETVEDLAKYDLSYGEVPLRWKERFMKKTIFEYDGQWASEYSSHEQRFLWLPAPNIGRSRVQ
jgi:hypothetical protein